jgi:peptidoglycan/xylan/chitin deacetylase (PgdA/CDA1 family)
MNKPNVLIIADQKDVKFLDINSQSEHWNIFWEIIDYNKLYRKIKEIHDTVANYGIDFVLYSRNDQVANRISIGPVTASLRIGYSSFSGIDENYRIEQMKSCFKDFLECNKRLDLSLDEKPLRHNKRERGTFSLIFDIEQLGGVRYGLPRVLGLLSRYNIKATFFITNLMKKVYPNILNEIQRLGHEIGLHGFWHEYLSNFSEQVQEELIQAMISDFGGQVHGANFIGRMNKDTLQALVNNKIEYFVYPLINSYHLFSYSKLSVSPSLLNISDKDIWMLPISVETYSSPLISIKNMIDLVISQNRKDKFFHISVLCHDFRDGNLAHIKTTEKLIRYLIQKRLEPITLKELLDRLSESECFHTLSMEELFSLKRVKVSPPTAKQDFLGFIPENLIFVYKLIRRGHTCF